MNALALIKIALLPQFQLATARIHWHFVAKLNQWRKTGSHVALKSP